jgi:regulator of replication initiation timing
MVEATNTNQKLQEENQRMEGDMNEAKKRPDEERQEIQLKLNLANELAVSQQKALAESNTHCKRKASEIKKLRGSVQSLTSERNALALEKKNLKNQTATPHDESRKQAGLKSEFETLQAENKHLQKNFDKQVQKKDLQEDLDTKISEKNGRFQIEKDHVVALEMKMEEITRNYEIDRVTLEDVIEAKELQENRIVRIGKFYIHFWR